MPITSARLSDMQTRAALYLADTCKIEYPTYASDGMGGQSVTWTTRGTAIACYVEAIAITTGLADMTQAGGRAVSFTEYTLHIAAGGTVEPDDKVTHNSMVYYVESVIEPKTRRALKSAKMTMERD